MENPRPMTKAAVLPNIGTANRQDMLKPTRASNRRSRYHERLAKKLAAIEAGHLKDNDPVARAPTTPGSDVAHRLLPPIPHRSARAGSRSPSAMSGGKTRRPDGGSTMVHSPVYNQRLLETLHRDLIPVFQVGLDSFKKNIMLFTCKALIHLCHILVTCCLKLRSDRLMPDNHVG